MARRNGGRTTARIGEKENVYANGLLTATAARLLGMGPVGCAYRGRMTCFDCPYAHRIARLCDYKCSKCPDQVTCFCGQMGQEARVDRSLTGVV